MPSSFKRCSALADREASRITICQATRDGLEAAFRDHRNRNVHTDDRVIDQRSRDIDYASTGLLSQHLLDHKLGDEKKTFDVDGNESPQIVKRVIREVLREIYAGVVDEHIDPTESRYGGIHDLGGRARVTDVSGDQCKIRRRRERIYLDDVSRVRNYAIATSRERLHESRADPL